MLRTTESHKQRQLSFSLLKAVNITSQFFSSSNRFFSSYIGFRMYTLFIQNACSFTESACDFSSSLAPRLEHALAAKAFLSLLSREKCPGRIFEDLDEWKYRERRPKWSAHTFLFECLSKPMAPTHVSYTLFRISRNDCKSELARQGQTKQARL